jgi:hypothetical protein
MNTYEDDDPFWNSLLTERPAWDGQPMHDDTINEAPSHTDLAWVLTGERPQIESPKYLTRTDGAALFYSGKLNILYGQPESGKSWVAYSAAVEALNNSRVAIIDADYNGAVAVVDRLLRLGAKPEDIANPDRFRLIEPEDGTELRKAIRSLVEWNVELVILDSLGEIVPMLGLKSLDNDEVTNAIRQVVVPLKAAGACVIAIDHLPKPKTETKSGAEFSIGAMAKKRACDGAMILCEISKILAPGLIGQINMTVTKDRHGQLRKNCIKGDRVGIFTLDSTDENISHASIGFDNAKPAADGGFRPTILMENISRYLSTLDGPESRSQIKKHINGNNEMKDRALDVLLNEGYISETIGARGARMSTYIKTFKNELPEPEITTVVTKWSDRPF